MSNKLSKLGFITLEDCDGFVFTVRSKNIISVAENVIKGESRYSESEIYLSFGKYILVRESYDEVMSKIIEVEDLK